jgi:colanic acid/amylovoran biosynthesis glycosyltransferase
MELILFTTNFPLGASEQFLECEILYLSQTFEKITIVPLTASGRPNARPLPGNVTFLPPMLSFGLNDKRPLALKGLFNNSPMWPFVLDLFAKGGYKNPVRFMHWLSATTIARATFASDSFKKMIDRVTSDTLFYFYWGDKSSALCPLLKKTFPGNKSIVRFHGSDLYEVKSPGYMPFREQLVKNLDLAVFVSENGRQFFRNKFPSIGNRTLLARLGVLDHGTAKYSNDGIFRIVTCSNMVRIKRLHLLVEALRKVHFPVEWHHFGDGELMNEIKALAQQLPGNIKTIFPGLVTNKELLTFYQGNPVDLFVNTSSTEGIPVSIMEALSFGIPVAAPAVGGISEIVNGNHGCLLSCEATPNEISQAIIDCNSLTRQKREGKRIAARIFWAKNFDANVNYSEFCRHLTNEL